MVYGYIRVSTDKQTVENQRFEIERFCKKEGLTIDGWIEETISGTKNYNKRALGKLLNRIVKDDLIICTELSRLGRNLFMIMEILNICMTKESRVWTIKDNYRLGDDIQSKVLAFAFGLSAEIERNLISQRTKEALARLKKEGHPVGRGQGQRNKQLNAKCVAKHKYIESQMEKGISVPQIAKKLRIARGTLYRYLAYTGLRTPTKSRNGRWEENDGFISLWLKSAFVSNVSAGLGTDLKELIKTGPVCLACCVCRCNRFELQAVSCYLVFGFGDGGLCLRPYLWEQSYSNTSLVLLFSS